MIRHSFFDYNYDYLRFDTEWKFEWDIDNETEDTIHFYPFTQAIGEDGTNLTWRFCGVGNADDCSTIVEHSEYVWDPTNPILEYQAANEEGTSPEPLWDPNHPDNLTHYLSPFGGQGIITLTNTVETVIIDTVPPEFVTDAGTEYILIKTPDDKGDVYRHVELVFRDKAGLDFKYFTLSIDGQTLYDYDRKTEKILEPDLALIKKKTLKVYSDGYNTYKIQFDLKYDKDIEDVLQEKGLSLKVWDKSANFKVYNFGTGDDSVSVNNKKWIFIDAKRALDEFEPLQITFSSVEPADMIIKDTKPGEAWCTIFNPNQDLWALGMNSIVSQLTKESLGWIDTTTLTDVFKDLEYNPDGSPTHYEDHGCIKFKIINVDKAGDMEVEAWVRTGIEKFDGILKTVTYAKAGLKWMCMDPDGRLYNLKPYVPKYMRGTDYANFIEFFELYLNTVYTNMTRGTNISVLEKIAEIADFLDIDKIEDYLVRDYARHRGAEYDIDLMTMLNMNLGFFNPEVFGSRSESDVLDIVKYALKNLPMYNQLKGTEKGMILALRMFSFVCKLIPLWVRMSPQVEEYPNFYEEDRLYSFTGYFLTSRFNMEFDATNCDFKEFNDNLDSLVKFIKSIKPITKILNLIKYTIISDVPTDMLIVDKTETNDDALKYKLVYNQSDIDDMAKHSKLDLNTMHAKRLWFGYRPHGESSIDGAAVPNMFTALASLFEKYRGDFKFTYQAATKTIGYSFTVLAKTRITPSSNPAEIWADFANKMPDPDNSAYTTFASNVQSCCYGLTQDFNYAAGTLKTFIKDKLPADAYNPHFEPPFDTDQQISWKTDSKNLTIDAAVKYTVTGTLSPNDDPAELFFQLTGRSKNMYGSKDINYARVNTQLSEFKKEFERLMSRMSNTDAYEKTFSLASAKVVILDTGLYLSFTDGNTATYVSDIFRIISAGTAGKEFLEKWATRSLGDPDVTIDGSDTLTIEFTHIPGTEVYNFGE